MAYDRVPVNWSQGWRLEEKATPRPAAGVAASIDAGDPAQGRSPRAMTVRQISLVPSYISMSFASR
jgi:hypothetical protein